MVRMSVTRMVWSRDAEASHQPLTGHHDTRCTPLVCEPMEATSFPSALGSHRRTVESSEAVAMSDLAGCQATLVTP